MLKQIPLKAATTVWITSTLAFIMLFIFEEIMNIYGINSPLLIGSFAASAVLLFAAPQSPFSHWKNVIGGHSFSAFIGVSSFIFLGEIPILATSIAVSTSIAFMYLTSTIHPPGGATAFIAVMGETSIQNLGYLYVVMPCLLGAVILCTLAWLSKYTLNTLANNRQKSLP